MGTPSHVLSSTSPAVLTMTNLFTLPVLLLVLAGVHPGTASYSSWTRCHAEAHQRGEWYDFNEYTPDLGPFKFDNTIESVEVKGMWIFYDNVEYNSHTAGWVFWASGVDYKGDVPYEYTNLATSLKYAGSPYDYRDDTWTVYSGEGFTDQEHFGNSDAANLGSLGDDVSSIIITGNSAWTFYDGPNYQGTNCVCLRPNF